MSNLSNEIKTNLEASLSAQQSTVDSKNVLEEMTIGEIGMDIPKDLLETVPDDYRMESKKINEALHWSVPLLHEVIRMYTPDLSPYIIAIIQTAHRKDKKGCDVNALDKYGRTPLQHFFNTMIGGGLEKDIYNNVELIHELILAGANIDSFNVETDGPKRHFESMEDRPNQHEPPRIGAIHNPQQYMTVVDLIMTTRIKPARKTMQASYNLDAYSITTWDPSKVIPEFLNKPAIRYLLKAIFEKSNDSKIFLSDLNKITKELNIAFPSQINAIISDYAASSIINFQHLSCFKRVPQFFVNLLKMGKQIYEEDNKCIAAQNAENTEKTHNNSENAEKQNRAIEVMSSGKNLTYLYSARSTKYLDNPSFSRRVMQNPKG